MGRAGLGRRVRAVVSSLVLVGVWCAGPALAPGGGAARAAQETFGRVPVLAYHNVDYSGSEYSVSPEQLDEQCRWLVENGYTAITLHQFWDAATGYGKLPPNPVLLTNDDGWASAITFAEILGRHGMVGTYFLNSVSPLTAEQILLLSQLGSVQAHTANHAHLSGLDYEGQLAEIAENKTYLEAITGQPVQFLAWPFGDRNESAVQAAAAAGILGAFGLGGTAASLLALDPYHIPRIMMGPGDDLPTFAAKVGGW
jgi:peptidoglycan/xylan/chitin deacetylase (PgdA/CDA1 family)